MRDDLLDDLLGRQLRIDIQDAVAEPVSRKLEVVRDDQSTGGGGFEEPHRRAVGLAVGVLVQAKSNPRLPERSDHGNTVEGQSAAVCIMTGPGIGWAVEPHWYASLKAAKDVPVTGSIPVHSGIHDRRLRRQGARWADIRRRWQHQTIVYDGALAVAGAKIIQPICDLPRPA